MIEWHEENREIVWQDCSIVPPYYQRLEIALDATPHEIKQAYRRLARQLHPDHRVPSERSFAEIRMQRLNEAYAVLGNPQRRALYDRTNHLQFA
jgi:molecular chaperone DnaJ